MNVIRIVNGQALVQKAPVQMMANNVSSTGSQMTEQQAAIGIVAHHCGVEKERAEALIAAVKSDPTLVVEVSNLREIDPTLSEDWEVPGFVLRGPW